MVGRDENILVEFDYQNVVLVDPNKVVDSQGVVKERLLKHENLVYYANLECNLFPRTRLSVGNNGYYENKTLSVASINFIKPANKTFLTNGYLDELTGLNSIEGKGANQIVENKQEITKPDKTKEVYFSQSVANNIDNNLLLIDNIEIDTPLNLVPTVKIRMHDIKGRALFEQAENSPYSVFFNYPYPLFYLTVKGYLGKAIKYQLSLQTFNARFDGQSGNFIIDCTFIAYKYNVLTNITMEQAMSVPYMYITKYTKSPNNSEGQQSAQNQVGNTTKNVETSVTSRGYEKVKEVYSEYKSKGLIPEDFPEITIQELIDRLSKLETYIANTFTKADMAPITDAENYSTTLEEYEKKVFYARGESWFYTYMDTENFFVDKQTNHKVYTFNKTTFEGGKRDIATTELKGLIEKYNTVLSQNPTFGKGGNYSVGKDKNIPSEIPNGIDYNDFVAQPFQPENINWEETYRLRTGKEPSEADIVKLKSDTQTILNSVTLEENYEKIVYNFFYFESEGSFVNQIEIMKNSLAVKLNEIQEKLSQLLSERLSSKDSGLGFKPTIRNVLAVILASSEAFLRILCDVHDKAWGQRENKNRVDAILNNDSAAKNPDAKQSVQKDTGNLIPVYPWPQYFVETNNDKGEKFELTYPGSPKVIQKTKAYLYEVWPEVEFVEEFLKGLALRKNPPNLNVLGTNSAQIINKISYNALDFPTSNTIFANREEVRFFYEIWERVMVSSMYQRFMRPNAENEIQEPLADSEFINIKNSLEDSAPFLIQKLKQYNFTASSFPNFLAHISNNGTGESWQKYIRDEFVTKYLQNESQNDFMIYNEEVVSPGVAIVQPQPKNFKKIEDYLKSNATNEINFLDTFPYAIDGWYKNNMANGEGTNFRDLYNTTKTYVIHEDKKMVSNFNKKTSKSQNRPITNFSFNTPTIPTPTNATLRTFYQERGNNFFVKNQQVTEGTVRYFNYDGNVSDIQTTSMLNTPFFINSVTKGVDKFLSGDTYPFVAASYLLLNSLPIATLKEKYKTYENGVTSDLDYIFTTIKKFGAIHRIPYAWILKYGSIWHRYKKYIESNVDILDEVWTDFDAINNYDPITNNQSKVYSLTLPNNSTPTDIVLQSVSSVSTGTVSQMNLGFYPQLINKFNVFFRGYSLFSSYTDSAIQSQLDNTVSGFTLTPISNSYLNGVEGYDPSDSTDSLSVKTWNCTLLDKRAKIEYIVPSFGSTINQIKGECLSNQEKLIQPIKSNPAVFNGSVRGFWALPNYGYFDSFQINKPTFKQYLKQIIDDSNEQQSFLLSNIIDYSYNEEILSVFTKDIMDKMENEFLKFSKSMYQYQTQQVGQTITTTVMIDKLSTDPNQSFLNFQMLLKEMMSVEITTPNVTNSNEQTSTIKNKQFEKINNIIKNFLEYDIVFKYGNPGNYDRLIFDSFNPNVFVENKLTFNPYVQNSLPTSAVTNVSLATYISYNPQSWRNLELYVGYSTESGITYTSTGSTITDFFIDMNIEFIPENVIQLAPIIKIYATQKKIDPTLNKTKFVTLLSDFMIQNQTFSNGLFNMVFNKLRVGLPDIVEVPEKKDDTILQGELSKVDLWERFKGLNDTWIAGYDYTQTTFLEDVLILDRANRNISDEVLIDPFKVRELLSNVNFGASVYGYIESILDIHHFICMMHPGYINYYNVQEISRQEDVPKSEGTLEFGNTLFGTYLNVDTRACSPKLVCVYAAEPSKYQQMDKNDTYRFASDTFDLRRSSDNPLTENLSGKKDWGLSNKVVGFNLDIGIRNQNVFFGFDVSQDNAKPTAESLAQNDRMIRQANGKEVATQNVSLWNFYNNRSYQCRVSSLGNAMIQPTMYFNLRHVPMFNGPYYILDVKHTISPGKFETQFTGIRQQIFSLPKMESYIQTLTKQLFVDLKAKINQKINTNPSDNATTNSSPATAGQTTTTTTSNVPVVNTNTVDNSQNCQPNLNPDYSTYIAATQTQTSLSTKEVIDGMNQVIRDTTGNLDVTKMLSFVTTYLASYKNQQFTAWNNNFANVQLTIKWPGELPKFFKNEYLCNTGADGYSYPYATFLDANNLFELLQAKWKDVSPDFQITSESLTKAWVTKWNRTTTMTQEEYDQFILKNQTYYNNLLLSVKDAINLATTLGLISPPPPTVTLDYLGEFTSIQGNNSSYYNIKNKAGKYYVLRINDATFDDNNVGLVQFFDENDLGGLPLPYNCGAGVDTNYSNDCVVNSGNPGRIMMTVQYYPKGVLNSTLITLNKVFEQK
jgi:hypothetical protein